MREERLKSAREALGLSREQLAERLHVHVSTIGHWELAGGRLVVRCWQP